MYCTEYHVDISTRVLLLLFIPPACTGLRALFSLSLSSTCSSLSIGRRTHPLPFVSSPLTHHRSLCGVFFSSSPSIRLSLSASLCLSPEKLETIENTLSRARTFWHNRSIKHHATLSSNTSRDTLNVLSQLAITALSPSIVTHEQHLDQRRLICITQSFHPLNSAASQYLLSFAPRTQPLSHPD